MGDELEELCKACSNFQEVSLFGNDEKNIEVSAIKYLESRAYKVIAPPSLPSKVTKSTDLKALYERLVDRYHPEWRTTYIKEEQARAIAKNFVKSRMKAEGISKERAIRSCAEIICAVFQFEDEFNFNRPINFSMFGQAEFKWVSDRAIEILNKKESELEDVYTDILIDRMYEDKPNKGWSFNKLNRAYDRLKEKDNAEEKEKGRKDLR